MSIVEQRYRQWWDSIANGQDEKDIVNACELLADAVFDNACPDRDLEWLSATVSRLLDDRRGLPVTDTNLDQLEQIRALSFELGWFDLCDSIDDELISGAGACGQFDRVTGYCRRDQAILTEGELDADGVELLIAVAGRGFAVGRTAFDAGDFAVAAELCLDAATALQRAWAALGNEPFGDTTAPSVRVVLADSAQLLTDLPLVAANAIRVAAVALGELGELSAAGELFERARELYGGAGLRIGVATIDFAWGNVAVKVGDAATAKTRLELALPTLIDERDPQAGACLTLMAAIAVMEGALDDAADLIGRAQSSPWIELRDDIAAELDAMAELQAASAAFGDNDIALATRHLDQAQRSYRRAGEPLKAIAAMLPMVTAWARAGKTDAARALAEQVRHALASEPSVPAQIAGLTEEVRVADAEIAIATGARPLARELLRQSEAARLTHDSTTKIEAAQIAIRRARLMIEDGELQAGLDLLLPALVALDAYRCRLRSARQRVLWSKATAGALALAYRTAARLGHTRLIAELIESAHGNAMPQAAGGQAGAMALLGQVNSIVNGQMDSDSTASGSSAPLGQRLTAHGAKTVAAGAWALGDPEQIVDLGPPPNLRMPWGAIALEAAIGEAMRYLNPVRAPEVAQISLAGVDRGWDLE